MSGSVSPGVPDIPAPKRFCNSAARPRMGGLAGHGCLANLRPTAYPLAQLALPATSACTYDVIAGQLIGLCAAMRGGAVVSGRFNQYWCRRLQPNPAHQRSQTHSDSI